MEFFFRKVDDCSLMKKGELGLTSVTCTERKAFRTQELFSTTHEITPKKNVLVLNRGLTYKIIKLQTWNISHIGE